MLLISIWSGCSEREKYALEWIMTQQGATWVVHYLDDYLTIGSSECQENVAIMATVNEIVGLLINSSCTLLYSTQRFCTLLSNNNNNNFQEGGTGNMFNLLGSQSRFRRWVIRLPADKLQHLQELLHSWCGRKAWELLSLFGIINHTCKVIQVGCSFLRRLIDVSTTAKKLNHYIRLNGDARSNI